MYKNGIRVVNYTGSIINFDCLNLCRLTFLRILENITTTVSRKTLPETSTKEAHVKSIWASIFSAVVEAVCSYQWCSRRIDFSEPNTQKCAQRNERSKFKCWAERLELLAIQTAFHNIFAQILIFLSNSNGDSNHFLLEPLS